MIHLEAHQLPHPPDQVRPLRDDIALQHRPRIVIHIDPDWTTISGTVPTLTQPLEPSPLELQPMLRRTSLLLRLGTRPLHAGNLCKQLTLTREKPLRVGDLLLLGVGPVLEVDQVLRLVSARIRRFSARYRGWSGLTKPVLMGRSALTNA